MEQSIQNTIKMEFLAMLDEREQEEVFKLSEMSNVQELEVVLEALAQANWNTEKAFLQLLHLHQSPKQTAIKKESLPTPNASFNIQKQQQDEEYFRIADLHAIKQQSEFESKKHRQSIENESARDKAFFATHSVSYPVTIKLRLATQTVTKAFDFSDSVETLYRYVNGFLRKHFEDPQSRFDLLEIPSGSLGRRMEDKLAMVFGVQLEGVTLNVREE